MGEHGDERAVQARLGAGRAGCGLPSATRLHTAGSAAATVPRCGAMPSPSTWRRAHSHGCPLLQP